ncbi:uncharacterized protein M421DRAFT_92340 [Didymella exigua CBS 183.55]|uniref:SnoaL-like domain-containing protein n=1 Tax=Didymella exigua CBS 183.55 TaxID=1150837 RepID=A0A6A5RNM1_9PLEO|nr:uncharacterized protein M421DRAFT_92340 [Didymella exigua CBS 183.55]KAF1928624.1 hypothetical protein M421DRAFT_92340 [Didymella exigua CBS 183.55]
MAESLPQDLEQHIKALYHAYRHTPSIAIKALFFSSTCLQSCRPTPSYSATSRLQIAQYLQDAQQAEVPPEHSAGSEGHVDCSRAGHVTEGMGRYTIRPLRASEHKFGDTAATAALGVTPVELSARAEAEGWTGMRVDLWDEGPEAGLLVKVQYWWRLESLGDESDLGVERGGEVWRQCLHDIMYLGPRDGTEGAEGLEILR